MYVVGPGGGNLHDDRRRVSGMNRHTTPQVRFDKSNEKKNKAPLDPCLPTEGGTVIVYSE